MTDLRNEPISLDWESPVRSNLRLLAFRQIAAPLMAAVSGLSRGEEAAPRDVARTARDFGKLIDSAIEINRIIVNDFGFAPEDDKGRWQAAAATTDFVAAHYRATGRVLEARDAGPLIEALRSALSELGESLPTHDPAESDTYQPLARSLKALAPAVSAIARFSFGRNALELLSEVTRHLTATALEITARLSGQEGSSVIESPLYHAVLEVTGEFYLESHFAEMDRLLEMDPEERKTYVRDHDKKIPMEPVWEALELRLGMLEALVAYLPLPGNTP